MERGAVRKHKGLFEKQMDYRRGSKMDYRKDLLQTVESIWSAYLNHPFLVELEAGSLPKEKFKNYLVQDYLYLKEYARVFCIGVSKAKTMKEMKFFYHGIQGAMEDETEVHIQYLLDFGIRPEQAEKSAMLIDNINYTSYMQAIALRGDLKDILAAVMPCAWSYNYIGLALKEKVQRPEENFYMPWIDSYASDSYTQFTEAWIQYTEETCQALSQEEYERFKEIFIASSLYEMKFWDMAYADLEENIE